MSLIIPTVAVPQGGASLMIAFRCNRKNILVYGYNEIAASRVLYALEADANVTLVGPLRLMCNDLLYRIQEGQIDWLGEQFEEEQLIGNHLVFVTRLDDIELCKRISYSCCSRRIPVNVANHKDLSDFDMTCTYRDQSLQVAVSTNGHSSVNLANRILQSKISSALSPNLGEAVKNVGILRKKSELLYPGSQSSVTRYQWLSNICEYSSLNTLATLTSSDIDDLLKTYSSNKTQFQKEEYYSTSSPITFLVQNDSITATDDIKMRNTLEDADVFIVDSDILKIRNQELSLTSCKIESSPDSLKELNTIGLNALENGKRIVRLVSSINDKSSAEVLFYRNHGYIPLFIHGDMFNNHHASLKVNNLSISSPIPA